MPRAADPEKIRRLLAATRQLLIRCGFSGTSVDRICREAGVSKGIFFHYFKTKEDAVIAVARDFVAELGRQFKARPYARGGDPRQQILQYIDFTISACEHSVLSAGCLIGTLSTALPEAHEAGIRAVCREAFSGWVTSFEGLLQTAKQSGLLATRIDTRTLACQFIALVEGSLLLRNALGADILRRNLQGFRDMLAQLMEPRRNNAWTEA
jgi:TetR/AcrR family transcriptional regulator, transcriptional repressor for nem operon